MSPTIQIAVSGRVVSAVIDTGSKVTPMRESTVSRLHLKLNKRRAIPTLTGVTGSPLRILGSAKVTIAIGYVTERTLSIPVAPDSYLDSDMLLGVDVLNRAVLKCDGPNESVMWGDAVHPIRPVLHSRTRSTKKVKQTSPKTELTYTALRVSRKILIPSGHNGLTKIKIKEQPGTVVLVEPFPQPRQICYPYCTTVDENQHILWPIGNSSKRDVVLKVGTYLADWIKIDKTETEPNVRAVTQLHSDLLLPTITEPPEGITRTEKLKTLLSVQDWKHLSRAQQQLVEEVILKYDTLFILNSDELAKIKGKQAELVVKDSTPVRNPLYRYPEQAKELIEDIIKDMLEKRVIEPSTAAWLSPMVLVNKPDGSKRLCLDYRKVNEHLETDIYP